MPEHFQVVVSGGQPQPRPSRPTSTTEQLRARAAAEAARLGVILERRADQTCHYCAGYRSGLYQEAPPGPCPACGRITVHNGHDVLARHSAPIIETRSTSGMRCGMCGDTYRTGVNACCAYGFADTP